MPCWVKWMGLCMELQRRHLLKTWWWLMNRSGFGKESLLVSSSSRSTPLEHLFRSVAPPIEKGILGVQWIVFSKAFLLQIFQVDIIAQRRTAAGVPEVRYVLSLAILSILVLLWIHRSTVIYWVRRAPLHLWALSAYIALSVMWSIQPEESIQKVFLFFASTGLGVLLADRMPCPKAFLPWFAGVLGFLMLSSFVVSTLFPRLGTYEEFRGTVWIGVFTYKNILGMFSALSMLVAFTWVRRGSFPLVLRIFLLIFGVINLWNSRAVGAQVYCLVTLMFAWPFWSVLRKLSLRALAGVGSFGVLMIVGMALWVWQHLTEILVFLGRDATLTNRIPLWGAILWTLQHYGRLWIGMGYEAFFGGWANPATRWVWRIVGWRPMQAHSGYVQAIADLGLVGLALSVWVWVTALYRVFRAYRRDPSWTFPLLFLTFLTLMNVTETVFTSTSVYATLAIWAVVVWSMLTSAGAQAEDSVDGLNRSGIKEENERFIVQRSVLPYRQAP